MKEFLEKELDKLKISKGEREILVETYEEQWEWFEEDFISEHSRKPNEKDEKKFIKDFLEKMQSTGSHRYDRRKKKKPYVNVYLKQ